MVKVIRPTEESVRQAQEAGLKARQESPLATAVRFDKGSSSLVLTLVTGISILIPVSFVEELRDIEQEELAHLHTSISGKGIVLDSADIHISVDGLVLDALGAPEWKKAMRSHLLREASGRKTEKKAASSKLNGTKGGRPPKSIVFSAPGGSVTVVPTKSETARIETNSAKMPFVDLVSDRLKASGINVVYQKAPSKASQFINSGAVVRQAKGIIIRKAIGVGARIALPRGMFVQVVNDIRAQKLPLEVNNLIGSLEHLKKLGS